MSEDVLHSNTENNKDTSYDKASNEDKRKSSNDSDNNEEKNSNQGVGVVELTSSDQQRVLFINRNKRLWVFILIISINVMANTDHGTLPAATNEIQRDIKIGHSRLGLLGTLVFTGNLIGSLIAIPLINRFESRKWLLTIMLYSNVLFQSTFYGIPIYYYLVVNRIFVGISQSFIMIYSPIWVDQFAPRNRKTFFMAIQQVASPFGVVLGYSLTAGVKATIGWGYSYLIQSALLLILAIITTFVDRFYFLTNLKLANPEKTIKLEEKPKEEQKVIKTKIDEMLDSEEPIPKRKVSKKGKRQRDEKKESFIESAFSDANKEEVIGEEAKVNINTNTSNKTLTRVNEPKENKEDQNGEKNYLPEETPEGTSNENEISIYYDFTGENIIETPSFFRSIGQMCQLKIFMLLTIAGTILFYIVTVIQFWVSDYLRLVMKVEEGTIFIAFVVTCVTSPTLGIIIGGWIVQKSGGYEGKHSILYVFLFSLVSAVLGIFITSLDDLVSFAICLWMFLFFGGGLVPNLVGIIVYSLPTELKAPGLSFKTVLDNLLGFLPAPYIYGLIYEETKESNPKLSMRIMFLYTSVGSLFIFIGLILRYRKFSAEEKELKTIQENFLEMKAMQTKNENEQVNEANVTELKAIDESYKIENRSFFSDANESSYRDAISKNNRVEINISILEKEN